MAHYKRLPPPARAFSDMQRHYRPMENEQILSEIASSFYL